MLEWYNKVRKISSLTKKNFILEKYVFYAYIVDSDPLCKNKNLKIDYLQRSNN